MTLPLQIRTIVSSLFEENCYVVRLPDRGDCVVIDPGLDPDWILDSLRDEGLTVAAILNTHGHADHIAGNAALKEAFPAAPLLIGAGDVPLLSDPMANLSGLFGMPLTSPPADRAVRGGDVVEAAGLRLEVLDVPGHSPGHVAFVHRGAPDEVFGGDVLFRGGIGRTDWPGADHRMLLRSIRTQLFTLPDDTVVYPGHGPVTTVGHERRTNPFVND
jgi:glyoxylase-like metal-dependent hydrolase (beta-lactamase superfamily II)